jgi:hypothetical protein
MPTGSNSTIAETSGEASLIVIELIITDHLDGDSESGISFRYWFNSVVPDAEQMYRMARCE